ncbi:MAG: tRNA (adenosine(37)-N6)-threonylcarbamoyltransferase complex ATPase subunit type 1 TsaE [Myxococcota bacterium]
MLERVLHNEAETLALARDLAQVAQPGDLFGLEGELGAGKTTFVRGAIHGLGVSEDMPVTSPTFALLQEYPGRLPIAHADFYRLMNESELDELGFEEWLDSNGVVFVEWGRKFPSISERVTLWVELAFVSDDARHVRLVPQSPRGAERLESLQRHFAP